MQKESRALKRRDLRLIRFGYSETGYVVTESIEVATYTYLNFYENFPEENQKVKSICYGLFH